MKLTAVQYRTLKVVQRFHNGGYKFKHVAPFYIPKWIFYGTAGLIACLWVAQFFPVLGYVLTGFFAGVIINQLAYIRAASRVWPVTDTLYDWPRVQSLIEEHEKDPRSAKEQQKLKTRTLIIIWLIIFLGIILLMYIKDHMNPE